MSRRWSASDLSFLHDNLAMTNLQLAAALRRTCAAIHDKKEKLRLRMVIKSTPEKIASGRICHAVSRNEIQRGRCIVCGKANAEGHHEDYTKPLDVIWLCKMHHKKLHRDRKQWWKVRAVI